MRKIRRVAESSRESAQLTTTLRGGGLIKAVKVESIGV